MIACHCNAVRDSAIGALAAEGCDADDIAGICGAGADCGGCRPTIEMIVDRIRSETRVLIGNTA
jgi:bacterioferritin-associated ferredoxin